MGKKCKVMFFLFICLYVFAGCSQEQCISEAEFPQKEHQGQEEVVEPERNVKERTNEENNVETVNREYSKIDVDKVNLMLEELNKKEVFLKVMSLGDEMLLLQCKNRENSNCTFYVLHMNEGEENLQRTDLNLEGEVDCYTYDDCIVLYDNMSYVMVLNYQLEIVNKIIIPDYILSSQLYARNRNYCVFPKEQRVFYYEPVLKNGELFVGLYETDYTYESSQLVYKLEGPETNLNFLNGFFEICPGYSQKGIFFTGDYFETPDSPSKKCVGYLDLDSDTPVVCKTSMQQMELTADGAVFFDGYRENDSEYSGELLMIDESGEVSRMKTAHFKESERGSCDRQGRMLTCYETDSGETVLNLYNENVWEKQVVIPGNVEDFELLNQAQCILGSYRSQDGLRILLQDI